MLQAVDQRSASSAGLAPTGAEGGGGRCGSSGRCCNAPRALLHIAARPDARIAARAAAERRAVQQRDQGRAGPTQVDFRCTIAADSQQWSIRRRRKSQNFNAKKNKWLRPT
jgi:hypothetical protein